MEKTTEKWEASGFECCEADTSRIGTVDRDAWMRHFINVNVCDQDRQRNTPPDLSYRTDRNH
eukprot:2413004-Amphidinium_carterae.1